MSRPRVAVLGAGCVGAWMGGMLARAGWAVTLIGRSGLCDSVRAGGLEVAALGERPVAAPVIVTTRPEGAAGADVLIVSVKGRDTRRAAEGVRRRLRADTVVMSFQNGLRNPARLRAVLPAHRVVPGMVSFNVAWETVPTGGARFRQLTSGPVALEDGAASPIVGALRSVGVAVSTVTDMQPVQWTKLVLNLNNAVNALSGLPLAEQLSHRGYRRILAEAMDEAWTVMDAAGIRSLPLGRMRPRVAPWILPLPDALFRLFAAPMVRIDPAARSSMADDLARGRSTEIQDINGEIVRLGAQLGIPTPVNARLVALVRAAETAAVGCPGLSPEALAGP